MNKDKFEVILINDQVKTETIPEKACSESDICHYVDFSSCPKVDECGVDYTSS